jgi:hypothetical protein
MTAADTISKIDRGRIRAADITQSELVELVEDNKRVLSLLALAVAWGTEIAEEAGRLRAEIAAERRAHEAKAARRHAPLAEVVSVLVGAQLRRSEANEASASALAEIRDAYERKWRAGRVEP